MARLGGDEFAILQASIKEPAETTSLTARIIEVINAPFDLNGQQVVVGMEASASPWRPPMPLIPIRFKLADMALYRAKGDGRGTYLFFEPEDGCAHAGATYPGTRSAQGRHQWVSSSCTTSRW